MLISADDDDMLMAIKLNVSHGTLANLAPFSDGVVSDIAVYHIYASISTNDDIAEQIAYLKVLHA